ncbi:MAG: AMP-binding protein [Solirubrobacterales bacterium]|nr:AMP-binding protein [Solirubrobacterales bacterium]MBV9049209.1 AMP-binding protein [Solirubrobacterales bacterium]
MSEISDVPEVQHAHRSELTPLSFLERSEFVYPDKVAVVYEERRYTYREMGDRVRRLASALRDAGLQRGDRVAFIAPNIPPLLEAHYGVPAAGGVLVAINYRLNAEDAHFILEHSGARFVFVDHEFEKLADAGSPAQTIRIDDSGAFDDPYEAFLAGGSSDFVPDALEDETDTISINYTSGTTGRPKGAVYHYRGAYLNALGEVIETQLTPDSVYLWTLPMFHCNGWCFTWAVTAVGARHVCLRKVEPGHIWELIDSERITHYNGAPTVQASLLNHERAHKLDREIITTVSGSPPTPELFARLTGVGIRPIHVYGSTELYGPYMVCERQEGWIERPVDEQARLLGRQGVNYVIAEPVRVVDDDGDEVDADGETLGEVLMRGNNVMTGYFEDPQQTEETLAGGWYHSGDLAVRHPDGYIELRDRKKDVIISGGENISTIEVEQAISRHPAVAEVAVVSTPDEKWGERPKAFIELAEGKDASEDEILKFAKEHLPGYMRPASVEIAELPKTSTGKIQKAQLRDREWEGHERRIG